MAALMCAPGHVQAEEIPSASKTVYDFSGWSNRGMLELFAKAADEGRQFPTKEEFEEAGIYLDLEFARSHVRYNPIIEQSAESNLRRHRGFSCRDTPPCRCRRSLWRPRGRLGAMRESRGRLPLCR